MNNRSRIAELIREEMAALPVLEHDAKLGIPLQVPSFGAEEVLDALEAMLDTQVTMGPRVRAFEEAWAHWCGSKHAVMVNSGSSANLLAWAGLKHLGVLKEDDEILVPAVGWSTTLFPILQNGLRAVLVDVDPKTLCMDPALARSAVNSRTRAVCVVHLLGCPCDMSAILELGLPILEDACAAHGAEINGKRVGSIGKLGSFSFFFSHHITTMEGGILVTDDESLADTLRSLRAHGWIREMRRRDEIARACPDTDPRFLFISQGYNLRPTDLAGAFGLRQLERLEGFIARRRANHHAWCDSISEWHLPLQVFPEVAGTLHSAFAFPFVLGDDAPYDRASLMRFLESRAISTRPISGGNLSRQPAMRHAPGLLTPHPLVVADRVHDRGFFIGNSHAFGPAHGALLLATLKEFHEKYAS